jgi:zinc protease
MQRLVLRAAIAGIALVALSSPAHAVDPEIKFEKYQLNNGLTVILSEDHRLPQVAVNIWYHVGAANQTPGKSGFAHLFEHMMFSGSKHVQPAPFTILQTIGTMAGAMANGTTSFDRTNYFEVVPSNELATALWIESDRMAFLLDTIDAKKLAIQRDVVSNERRQSYENRPYGVGFLKTCDVFYPSPHPYYECVIGSIPEIQAASVDDLKTFFRQWYGPQNASLAIVGDFDPAKARLLIEKYFGGVVNGPMPPRPSVPQPLLTKVVQETIEDHVAELPRFSLAWNSVKQFSDEEPAGDILAEVLGGGKTSRLYKTLVFDKQVASEIDAGNDTLGLGGQFVIAATVKAGHPVSEIVPLLQAEVTRIKKDGPTAAEVLRAQRKVIAQKIRQVEGLGGFGGKADILNNYQTYVGDPGYLAKDLARYRAVTVEQVKAFANKYLPDDKRLELTIVPAAKKPQASNP